MGLKLLFVCLISTCFHSWAVPLSSSNLEDFDSQLAEEANKIKRNIPSEDFGKLDDKIDSEDLNKRGVEALQAEDQQFEKRGSDDDDYDNEDDSDVNFDGRDKRGAENLDNGASYQDEDDEDEIVGRARRNFENADKFQDDEFANYEKRALGDSTEDDDDDDQDDLSDVEKRNIDDDLDEDDDDDDKAEKEDFAKKRKKRSAETATATPSVSSKKDAKGSKNSTCKSQRSVTLSDLDKLLSIADDDDEEDDNTEETESRNKRNMEDFFDNDDNDDDEGEALLSRNRRDLDEDDDEDDGDEDLSKQARDLGDDDGEDDDDDNEDFSRQARDLGDDDDDNDEDVDEVEEDEDDRKRRETNADDDDEEDDDSDFNNLVRMLRDTADDDDEGDEDDDGEKIKSVGTRDLSTSDISGEATENQPNSYEASNDNPAQNVDKRGVDDYYEDDLNSNIEQQLMKRDEGSEQPVYISPEQNGDFSEKDIDKTQANPSFTNIVIDEPDDFSISEQGDNPFVTINNPAMKSRNQRESGQHDKTSYRNKSIDEKEDYHDNPLFKSNFKQKNGRSKLLHSNAYYNDNSIMSKDEKTRRESSDVPENSSEPRGPIAKENELKKVFAGMFVQNPKADIQWVEPDMLANCWVHAMLAHSFGNGFSPSCNKDGTYSAKQCFLQRCWCVNRDGSPQDPYFDTRFFYAVKGAMHSCIQVY